ncbi:MAG: ABC transporter permease [Thermoplasmatota archaeon]
MSLAVAVKVLKEAWRQPKNLAITLLLPVVFMVIFGLAFGEEGQVTYDVAVVDDDGTDLSAAFVAGLEDLRYDDGQALLAVSAASDAGVGRERVQDREADLVIVIPAGFAEGLTPGSQEDPGTLPPFTTTGGRTDPSGTTLRIIGDPSRSASAVLVPIVEGYAQAFAQQVTGDEPALVVEQEQVTAPDLVAFDFIAPGLMVFGILNLVPQVAASLGREVESGTLDRFRLGLLRPWSLLSGVSLGHLVLASVSLALMLATAAGMGFQNQGSYLAAYVVVLVAAVAVIGVGLVIAALTGTQQEASSFGVLVSVPASFLSGAFFALPEVPLGSLAGRSIGLYDILPTTHAVDALRQVMTFGEGLGAAAFSLAAMAVLTVIWFAAGVGLFALRRLRVS